MLPVERNHKLSIEECKKYLKDKRYTEQEITEMRDELYQLANVLVEEYLSAKVSKTGKNGC